MEEAGKELKTKAIFNGERRFIFEMAIVLLLAKAKLLLHKNHCDIIREDRPERHWEDGSLLEGEPMKKGIDNFLVNSAPLR